MRLTFYYQWIMAISNIVKDNAFFTVTTKSAERFQAKLESISGVLFTAYFSKESPLVFSADLCRAQKENDWVVLWIIGDRPLSDSESPYIVKLVGSTTAPPGVLHMKELPMNELLEVQTAPEPLQESPIENTDLVVAQAPIAAEPTPGPEKIDASPPPAETLVPLFIPSFKAFRNFLSP